MFSIHETLLKDCHILSNHDSFSVLLHKNASIPWLICVPHTDKKNYYELDLDAKNLLTNIISKLSAFLAKKYAPDKINVAEIGNVVDQMHIHIIARKKDDPCWPKPVWGNLTSVKAYTENEMTTIKEELKTF